MRLDYLCDHLSDVVYLVHAVYSPMIEMTYRNLFESIILVMNIWFRPRSANSQTQ